MIIICNISKILGIAFVFLFILFGSNADAIISGVSTLGVLGSLVFTVLSGIAFYKHYSNGKSTKAALCLLATILLVPVTYVVFQDMGNNNSTGIIDGALDLLGTVFVLGIWYILPFTWAYINSEEEDQSDYEGKYFGKWLALLPMLGINLLFWYLL